VLTTKVLAHLEEQFPHAGSRVIYGETTRLGEARLREAALLSSRFPTTSRRADHVQAQGLSRKGAGEAGCVLSQAAHGWAEAAWQTYAPVQEKNGQTWQADYDANALGEVPAVCVRIPTGGGKTFLAAHAVARVARATAIPMRQWPCGWCHQMPSAPRPWLRSRHRATLAARR